MKRLLLVLIGSCFMDMGIMSAESDIQITNPIFSLFYTADVISESGSKVYTYEERSFFHYGNSLLSIKNQNIIFKNMLGFYEGIEIPIGQSVNGSYAIGAGPGLQIAAGGVYKFFSNDKLCFLVSVGPHFQFFEQVFRMGIEAEFQTKMFPEKLCSFVVGFKTNFDFYSNEIASVRVNKLYYDEDYTEYMDYTYEDFSVTKYTVFYIQPYISVCINLM